MNTFNIPIDSNTFVTDQIVFSKGEEHSVARINSLKFEHHKQSMNFMTTLQLRVLTIGFNDGRWVEILCQSPYLKKTKFSNLLKAFEALSPLTFPQRYKRYQNALRIEGYFDYSKIRIYAGGTISTIKNPDKRISLRNVYTENRLGMGKSYGVSWIGYSESDPSAIGIYEKPHGGIFMSNPCVQFKCREDRDVIMAFLRNEFRTFPHNI